MKTEVFGMLFTLALFGAGSLFDHGNGYLFLFLAAGAAAGALLGSIGGKKYGIDDTVAATMILRIISHLCVVVIFGPVILDWAMTRYPRVPPEALGGLTGGIVALFGTNVLITIGPLVGKWVEIGDIVSSRSA